MLGAYLLKRKPDGRGKIDLHAKKHLMAYQLCRVGEVSRKESTRQSNLKVHEVHAHTR